VPTGLLPAIWMLAEELAGPGDRGWPEQKCIMGPDAPDATEEVLSGTDGGFEVPSQRKPSGPTLTVWRRP
jgi:hypothetical protein